MRENPLNHLSNKKLWNKLTAVLLAVSVAHYPAAGFAETPLAAQAAKLEVPYPAVIPNIRIPEALGAIEEAHQGSIGKTIIYLQDAHASLEAQENIARLIEHLVNHYGVRTVYEEGYEGAVPTDELFGVIPEPDIKEKVSYFFMDKLRVSGAEYAHINRKQDFRLVGADHLKLHAENIAWYQKAAGNRDLTAEDLKTFQKEIQNLINRYFPREVKAWLKLKERFNRKELDLLEYLKRTSDLCGGGAIDGSAEFPNMALLLQSGAGGGKGEMEALKSIDAKSLFAEIERFEDGFAHRFLETERDLQIYAYHRALALFSRLNDMELEADEFTAAKAALKRFKTEDFADFIVKYAKKTVVLSKLWEANIQDAVRFYETAFMRDQAVESRLDRFLKSPDEGAAVLVFGGFHKQNIKEILEAKGFSFLIVSPKITQIEERHQEYYKELMSVGHHPFEVPALAGTATSPERLVELPNGAPLVQRAAEGARLHSGLSGPLLSAAMEKHFRAELRIAPAQSPSLKPSGPDYQNFFDYLWSRDSNLSIQDQVKDYAEKLAYVFAKNKSEEVRIQEAVQRLRVGMAYERPNRTKLFIISYFVRKAFHDALDRFFRLVRNLFTRPRRFLKWAGMLAVHPIWSAAMTAGVLSAARQYLLRIHKTGDAVALYLSGTDRIDIFEPDAGREIYSHEIVHWLKDLGFVSSELLIASLMDKLLDKDSLSSAWRLGVDETAPFTYEEIEERMIGILNQEPAIMAHLREMYEKELGENAWPLADMNVFKYADWAGGNHLIGLVAVEAILKGKKGGKPLSDRWWLFVPTVLFMRAHLFSDRDMFFMDREANRRKLDFIYRFAFLITQVLNGKDPISAREQDRLKMLAEELLLRSESYTGIPLREREIVKDHAHVWIDRITSERFEALTEELTFGVRRSELRSSEFENRFNDLLDEMSFVFSMSDRRYWKSMRQAEALKIAVSAEKVRAVTPIELAEAVFLPREQEFIFKSEGVSDGRIGEEALHWLESIGMIHSSLPVHAAVDLFLANRDLTPEHIDWEKVTVVPGRTAAEKRNAWLSWQLTKTIRNESAISLEAREKFQSEYSPRDFSRDAVTEERVYDDARSLGRELHGHLSRVANRLSHLEHWYVYPLIVLVMRTHLFDRKDMLHMDSEENQRKLRFIYEYSLSVIKALDRGEKATGRTLLRTVPHLNVQWGQFGLAEKWRIAKLMNRISVLAADERFTSFAKRFKRSELRSNFSVPQILGTDPNRLNRVASLFRGAGFDLPISVFIQASDFESFSTEQRNELRAIAHRYPRGVKLVFYGADSQTFDVSGFPGTAVATSRTAFEAYQTYGAPLHDRPLFSLSKNHPEIREQFKSAVRKVRFFRHQNESAGLFSFLILYALSDGNLPVEVDSEGFFYAGAYLANLFREFVGNLVIRTAA